MSVQWTRVPGAAVVVGPVVAEAVLDSRVVVEMATVDVVAAAGTVVETSQRVRMNNVDVADPNRNFQADEWEKLGSGGRAYVLRLRDTPAGGRGGRDGGRGGGAVDRLMDSEVQAQHRLRLMRTIPKQELSEAAVTKASCRRLRSVGPRTDATLVVVRIDMRLVLAITVD